MLNGLNSLEFANKPATGDFTKAASDQTKRRALSRLPEHVYHVANKASLDSIKQNGLLSTHALCERLAKADLEKFLVTHRPEPIPLSEHVVLRDQKPMPPHRLDTCLDGMHSSEWYRLLNGFVFFFCDKDGAYSLGKAYAPSVLLTLDGRKLLSDFKDNVYLAPINTGYTGRKAVRRSKETFVPWNLWIESGWETERKVSGTGRRPSHKPVELVIQGGVSNLTDYLLATEIVGL